MYKKERIKIKYDRRADHHNSPSTKKYPLWSHKRQKLHNQNILNDLRSDLLKTLLRVIHQFRDLLPYGACTVFSKVYRSCHSLVVDSLTRFRRRLWCTHGLSQRQCRYCESGITEVRDCPHVIVCSTRHNLFQQRNHTAWAYFMNSSEELLTGQYVASKRRILSNDEWRVLSERKHASKTNVARLCLRFELK